VKSEEWKVESGKRKEESGEWRVESGDELKGRLGVEWKKWKLEVEHNKEKY